MEKLKALQTDQSAIENDVIETLIEVQQPVSLPPDLKARMKADMMSKIQQEKSCKTEGFLTQRVNDGDWIDAMPGARYKILHDDGNGRDGVLSYLIRLEAGTEIAGHSHPFDEECLMLEGDLSLGDLTLYQGDFHFAAAGLKHAHISTKNGCTAFIRGALPL